jgi:hypothetical protein
MLAGSLRSESGCTGSKAAISDGETFQRRRTTPDFRDTVRSISAKVAVFQCVHNHVALPYSCIYGERHYKETVGDEKIFAVPTVPSRNQKVFRVEALIEILVIRQESKVNDFEGIATGGEF